MRSVGLRADNTPCCPYCGSTSLEMERTKLNKVGGFATVGIGLFVAGRKVRCVACGKFSKPGNPVARHARRGHPDTSATPTPPQTEAISRRCSGCGQGASLTSAACQACGRDFPYYMSGGRWHCSAHGTATCNVCALPGEAGAASATAPPKFSVILTDPGTRPVRVATALRQHCGLSVDLALALVDSTGSVVVHHTGDEAEAHSLVKAIVEAGGAGQVIDFLDGF